MCNGDVLGLACYLVQAVLLHNVEEEARAFWSVKESRGLTRRITEPEKS